MKTFQLKSAVWGLVLTLALASLAVAVPASAAPLATGANAIVVHAQDVIGGQVMVTSVTAAQDGWLLIWRDVNGMPDELIGYAPVRQGANANIAVDVKTTDRKGNDNLTATLWASLAPDANALTPFAAPDPSIMPGDSVLVVAFAGTLAGGAAPAVASAATIPTTGGVSNTPSVPKQNKISVHRQDAILGQVMVDSVTATQDGWLLIWRDANGAPGGLIGYAPVHQGVNTSVVVDIKTADRKGNDDLPATLWATFAPDPNALTPFAVPDASILGNSLVMVSFASTAD